MAQELSNNQGYITLLSVIAVGALSAIIATSLLFSGTTSLQTTRTLQEGVQARALAHTCAERALIQIKNDPSASGSTEITEQPGSCTYFIQNNNDEESIVQSRGIVNSVTKKLLLTVPKTTTTTDDGLPITTLHDVVWLEVADF
jgi:hypothetical protein